MILVSSAREDMEGIDSGSTYEENDVDSLALAKIAAISVSLALSPTLLSPFPMFWLERW